MAEAALLKVAAASLRMPPRVTGGPLLDRLMRSTVFGASDCWYWAGSVNRLGYGQMMALGESKAHRVAYRIFNGEIPAGLHVLHTCDTRCCVNPEHLTLGTHADNMADMAAKGRVKVVRKFGEANPMARLTAKAVAEIRAARAAGEAQIQLARRYGVSPMTVSRAVRGESWK